MATALGIPTSTTSRFLTLDQLIRKWRGKLSNCALVVLSACDTQRGIKSGDSVMTLPWGFFYAGAPTVVASLWKVDDTATALLMTRFYENLLGQYDESRPAPGHSYASGQAMTKADALREAKLWLRSLTESQLRRCLQNTDDQARQSVETALRGLDVGRTVQDNTPSVQVESRPFSHPHFWAAFVLLGDPG
jgi:CHAT domain-containing protein